VAGKNASPVTLSAAPKSVPPPASFDSAVQAIIACGQRLEARGLAAAGLWLTWLASERVPSPRA
jgi:hypothetical protein